MTVLTLAKALNDGLRAAMEGDPKVLLMGEDIGKLGGVFRVTDGLQKDFGEDRVFDTPLAESGIVGTAIGLAMRGYRPVCEIQFDGFVYPAFDQIVSQLAKMHARSRGQVPMPVRSASRSAAASARSSTTARAPRPTSPTPRASRSSLQHPADAYTMIQQAIASDDPVVFFEPKRRYWEKAEVDLGRRPARCGRPRVVRPGRDATLVAYGPMVKTCLEAATAAAEEGRELEVVDLRSLSPLDLPTVLESVRRTRRLVVVHEAPAYVGLGAEIAARVTEELYYEMEAPVLRVAGSDTPYPPSRLEEDYLPDLDRVLHAVDRSLAF